MNVDSLPVYVPATSETIKQEPPTRSVAELREKKVMKRRYNTKTPVSCILEGTRPFCRKPAWVA